MKYKTQWDLSLLYKGDNDAQIEIDVRKIETACASFEKKYRGKNFISTPDVLYKALKDFEALEVLSIEKPWWYFALRNRLNSNDVKAAAAATKIEQRLNNAANKIKFFILTIGKISKEKRKKFLDAKVLTRYRYFLERIFIRADYNLSEAEEQLVSLLSQTSYTMWVDGQERVLTQQTVKHKGKDIPLSQALNLIRDLPKNERRALSDHVNTVLKNNSQFAEAEINAVYNYKKVMDERRGYKKPYSATALGHENDEKTIEALVAIVTKYFDISKRFYTLHARLLGEKKIFMADRNTKIGSIKKTFDFDTSVSIVRNSFKEVDQKYADILDLFLKRGQIDVAPKKGKDNGAFCWGMGQLPTYVLLNHVDDIRSVETLAHEMGHAIHTEYSKQQPPFYQHYSTACAEVASTFFEQVVIDSLQDNLSEEEQLVFLHNKISGDVVTIFRQIACFNFELELHNKIRTEGQLSKEKIAKLLQKHLQSYLGKSVEVSDDDGYFYVAWSHIRRFFYVYSYAYGQIISRALYEKWKKDSSYAKKIEQFLSAGRSMSPSDIFKSIGITVDRKFFEIGLKGIEHDLKKLETLAKRLKKIQ